MQLALSKNTMESDRRTIKPSFFKVLVNPEYTLQLTLPPKFVKKHGESLPGTMKLRTSSGFSCDVKFERTGDDEGCFTEGWSDFVKHFKFGDYVFFWYSCDEMTFDVSVFGPNASEKAIPGISQLTLNEPLLLLREAENNEESGTSVEDDAAGSGTIWDKSWPCYEVIMKTDSARKSRIRFSKKFAMDTGLIGKKSVKLVYPPKQKHWHVKLREKNNPCYRLEMFEGWPEFWKSNGMSMQKTYSFVYNPIKNMIQVMVEGESS